MRLRPLRVVTVGDRALASVETQQLGTAFDRLIDGWIFHASIACHDQGNRKRNAGRIHHAVATEPTAGLGKFVAPGTHGALTVAGLHRQATQTGEDGVIFADHVILRDQHDEIAIVPGLEAIGLK